MLMSFKNFNVCVVFSIKYFIRIQKKKKMSNVLLKFQINLKK